MFCWNKDFNASDLWDATCDFKIESFGKSNNSDRETKKRAFERVTYNL